MLDTLTSGVTAHAETRPAAKTAGLPYSVFSVRIGTALERSKVTLRKWVFAIYLTPTISTLCPALGQILAGSCRKPGLEPARPPHA